jgi:hypothetical protein
MDLCTYTGNKLKYADPESEERVPHQNQRDLKSTLHRTDWEEQSACKKLTKQKDKLNHPQSPPQLRNLDAMQREFKQT